MTLRCLEQLGIHQMATQNAVFYHAQCRGGTLGVLQLGNESVIRPTTSGTKKVHSPRQK